MQRFINQIKECYIILASSVICLAFSENIRSAVLIKNKIQDQHRMNVDSQSSTPIDFNSPFPTKHWCSNHFNCLDLFALPAGNKVITSLSIGSQRSRIQLKQTILHRDRKTTLFAQQVVQLFLRLPHGLLWTKLSSSDLKIHLSLPPHRDLQPYASCSTTRALRVPSFKLGLLHTPSSAPGTYLDLRYRWNVREFNHEHYFYAKGCGQIGRWALGGVGVLDLKRWVLQKNDLKLGCQITPSSWAGVELEVDWFRNYKINYYRFGSYFDLLRISYIHKLDAGRWVAGINYQYNLESSEVKKIEAVIDWTGIGTGLTNVKTKFSYVNHIVEVALASTYKFTDKIKITSGIVINKLTNLHSKPPHYSLAIHFGSI